MKYALIIAALLVTSCSQKVVPTTTTQSPANTQHMNEAEYIKSKQH